MSDGRKALIIAARRTPVTPRGGGQSGYQADELAAPVLAQLVRDADLNVNQIDHVIMGNALYAGGNPARLAALRAGLPVSVPALTVDTQCCSGLDAILLGARLIEAGAAECVLAGGTESFSRSPIRMHRSICPEDQPVPYDRPSFAPPPFDDPDLADAAANLAARHNVSREAQAAFAVSSHGKALHAVDRMQGRLVGIGTESSDRDAFTRALTMRTALRAPILAGSGDTGLSAATIASEADGAAAVLLVSDKIAKDRNWRGLEVVAGESAGGDPAEPALVPISLGKTLMTRLGLEPSSIAAVEVMEAYAVQAMVTAEHLGLNSASLNRLGGALARGHPIGASGAILAVHIFEQLARTQGKAEPGAGTYGLALIAAAGGLASGMVVRSIV